MPDFRNLHCDDEARRAALLAHATLTGIDHMEVDQRSLDVFFLSKPGLSSMLDDLDGQVEAVAIDGGVRIRNIRVVDVVRVDDHLRLQVDREGDFSTYSLTIQHDLLDEPYKQCDFSFKVGCPNRFDCRPQTVCPEETPPQPPIDYLAKDYASFRRALLDLIPTLAPQWGERLEADLGITLVELLAYVGDYLSYYQDAVANEAWLETARQRLSVRRHARLIDYHVHDGASARTAVFIRTAAAGRLPAGTQILSRIDVPLESRRPPHPPELSVDLQEAALAAAEAVFETMPRFSGTDPITRSVFLHPDLNRMRIHTWANRRCCLPRGTTSLDLIGDLKEVIDRDVIQRGSGFLLLEEVKGTATGLAADADPVHRQLVRVFRVSTATDPLLNVVLTRLEWHPADALVFPLCVSTVLPDGTNVDDVAIVRGNLVLADHGRTIVGETHHGPLPPPHRSQRRAHQIRLREGPLSYRVPVEQKNSQLVSATSLQTTDPRQAVPQVTRAADDITAGTWQAVPDLLDSPRFAQHFAVETDNDGRANLRFGDNLFGLSPPDESEFTIDYRVGVGIAGNVGRDSLSHVIHPGSTSDWPGIESATDSQPAVRNPLAAWGGANPESIEQVKKHAPPAFHSQQHRAVTEQDYAQVAQRHPEVGHAVATFRWTGSWHTVFINIDPVGRTLANEEGVDQSQTLRGRVHDWVAGFTLAGYDLEVLPPIYVSLEIEIDICVDREHFRSDVEEGLLRRLSRQTFPDGSAGLFHPDNFTFGQPFYLSQLFSAVQSVEGVDSATVRRFIRQDQDDPEPARPATAKNKQSGYVAVDRLEIVRLDNDPNFLENGVLTLNMLGGK